MAYRDELQAASARANALDRELREAREKIAELEGNKNTALVKREDQALALAGSTKRNPWLGGPTRLSFERTVDGVVPESAYPDLVEEMRRAFGTLGTASTLGQSLAWSSGQANGRIRFVQITIASRKDKTTIRIEEALGTLAGMVFGGVLGGVGGGGIIAPIGLGLLYPPLMPVAIIGWLAGIYGVCRRVYRKRATKYAGQLAELGERLVELSDQAIADEASSQDDS